MSKETYTLGYGEGSMEWMTDRTADGHGAFLLPYLKTGMRFLDCGCGPGTLTIGFAQHVAPGETIGIDREIGQTKPVAAAAASEGIENLKFEQGDVYQLPYSDASFDVAFASAVLGSVSNAEQVVLVDFWAECSLVSSTPSNFPVVSMFVIPASIFNNPFS